MASHPLEDDDRSNFNWLRRACRGPTYTSYAQFSHQPYCSFDWGENGYAGCCNHGGELLYLSAPSKTKGLIMARGHFATSLYASLSRSQIDFGGPSTFGLEVSRYPYTYDPQGQEITQDELLAHERDESHTKEQIVSAKNGSTFSLGAMIDRGSFNYRWPVTEYYLDLHPNQDAFEADLKSRRKEAAGGATNKPHEISTTSQETSRLKNKDTLDGSQQQQPVKTPLGGRANHDSLNSPEPKHVGTCQMFSCAKGDMFYQVLRIEECGGGMKFPEQSQIVLTMGGPVWFQSFNDGDHGFEAGIGITMPRRSARERKTDPETHQENGDEQELVTDTSGGEPTDTIRYWDKEERGLEAKVYQLLDGKYEPIFMTKSKMEADNAKSGEGHTNLTAYHAVGTLPIEPANSLQHKIPRSATFLAAIRLIELDEEGNVPTWPNVHDLATSEQLYHHVGVNPDRGPGRFQATAAMWESIFLNQSKDSRPILDLSEFNMIGRSLEKILQVDLVPTSFGDFNEEEDINDAEPDTYPNAQVVQDLGVSETEEDLYSAYDAPHQLEVTGRVIEDDDDFEGEEYKDNESDRKRYDVLASNLFLRGGNVDLKALFWKIRFLIRIHKFLSHIRKPDALPSHKRRKKAKSIEDFQMTRIQTKVENVVRYLAKALLEKTVWDTVENPRTPMMPDCNIPGESNYYYVLITIWYVWHYFKEDFKGDPDWEYDWSSTLAKENTDVRPPILFEPNRVPSDNWTFQAPDRDKASLLRWYHYGSLLKLCQNDVLPSSWHQRGLPEKVERLAKAAKLISSAKLSSEAPYVADDEIFDRLSFLSDELHLEVLGPKSVGTVVSLSMNRVSQRDFTRSLNPGWLPRAEEDSTSGPWEIHALCHHSRLVVLTKEEKSEQDWRTPEHTRAEAKAYRQKIATFLNAEGTLIPCWERAHAKARKGWLRSEATAVVASTLIIILDKVMFPESPASNTELSRVSTAETTSDGSTEEVSEQSQSRPSVEQTLARLSRTAKDHSKKAHEDQKTMLLEMFHLQGLMKGQLEAFKGFTNESGLLPPIQWISFRPTRKYHPLSFFNSLEDTPELYKFDVLGNTSVPMSLCDYIQTPHELKRDRTNFKKQDIDSILPQRRLVLFDLKANEQHADEDGFAWKAFKYKYDSSDEKTLKRFSWALYDNLVDQEVQHRFLTVTPSPNWEETSTPSVQTNPKKPSPIPREVLELLVYVIHPESAACLGDYLLNLSRFSCQTGDTWVASITLRSWRRLELEDLDKHESKTENKSWKPSKKKGKKLDSLPDITLDDCHSFHLPSNLRQVWERKGVDEKTIFRPEVTSIILSTNAFGDFSKCTVVSGLIEERELEDKMESIVEESRKLWQKFIHQPQTARCLVFLLILGRFCQQITDHYDKAISTLSSILRLDSTFTNTEDEYPPEFELGVWSLDALHKLQNSLNATVVSLETAKAELTKQITDGPGKRSIKLERMCQGYLGDFDNNLVQLVAVNVKLDRRIELNTRNKDATSAVLTMRDSRTAITQNSTIQKLTYLTIGYLPIALMAALYAIPTPQMNVIFPHMVNHGRSWFVGSIFILSVATYTLAIFIGNILDFFRYPPPRHGGKGKKPTTADPPNIWRGLGDGFKQTGEWLHDTKDGTKSNHKQRETHHNQPAPGKDASVFSGIGHRLHHIWEENRPKHHIPTIQLPLPQDQPRSVEEGRPTAFTRMWNSLRRGGQTMELPTPPSKSDLNDAEKGKANGASVETQSIHNTTENPSINNPIATPPSNHPATTFSIDPGTSAPAIHNPTAAPDPEKVRYA